MKASEAEMSYSNECWPQIPPGITKPEGAWRMYQQHHPWMVSHQIRWVQRQSYAAL